MAVTKMPKTSWNERRRQNGNKRRASEATLGPYGQIGNLSDRASAALVVTLSEDVTLAPAGETEAGLNVQAAPAGRFEQDRPTAWLKPFWGVTDTMKLAACPA